MPTVMPNSATLASLKCALLRRNFNPSFHRQLVEPSCWLAPESLTVNPVYSKASDVYAYAMVLFEIASRSLPYAGARVNIEEHVKNGERPLIPDVTPTGFTKLIEQGWHQKPEERPGIHYFLRRLEASGFIPLAAPSIVPRGAQATPSISSFRAAPGETSSLSSHNVSSQYQVFACSTGLLGSSSINRKTRRSWRDGKLSCFII